MVGGIDVRVINSITMVFNLRKLMKCQIKGVVKGEKRTKEEAVRN